VVSHCVVLCSISWHSLCSYSILYKPVYKAETTLFLGKEKDQVSLSFSDIQVNNQLVVDYREILQSRRVAEIINQKFGVEYRNFKKM